MKKITKFKGQYQFLSNFYPAARCLGGTAEHEFQIHKSLDTKERQWVYHAETPKEAKYRGGAVTLREDWEVVKDAIMYNVLWAKFCDPELRRLLLSTGDAYLEEGNTWGDRVWGTCGGKGQNRLGHLLMLVRALRRLEVDRG